MMKFVASHPCGGLQEADSSTSLRMTARMGHGAFADSLGSQKAKPPAGWAGGLLKRDAFGERAYARTLPVSDLFDLVDDLGVEGENALHPLPKAHLAHGKGTLGSFVDGDDEAFEGLEALFIAFLDLDLDANLVAGDKRGQIGALQLVGQALHYWMYGHGLFLLLNSELQVYQRKTPSA